MAELVEVELVERDGGALPVRVPAERDEFWSQPMIKEATA